MLPLSVANLSPIKGKNASSADNQQGRLSPKREPSETTRRAPTPKEIKAYLLGALHDATLSQKSHFRYSQKGTKWLRQLKKLFTQLNCNSWIYKEGKTRSVYVLETLAYFLDFKFNPLILKTRREKISYVRGFFDAEGGLPQKPSRFYIQLVQADKSKLRKLQLMLSQLKVVTGSIHNPSKAVNPNYWRMYVCAKSHCRFARIIGSWHPKRQKVFRSRMMI